MPNTNAVGGVANNAYIDFFYYGNGEKIDTVGIDLENNSKNLELDLSYKLLSNLSSDLSLIVSYCFQKTSIHNSANSRDFH